MAKKITKKPAKKAAKKVVKKAAKKSAKKATKKAAPKKAAKKVVKKATKRVAAKKAAPKKMASKASATKKKVAKKAAKKAAPKPEPKTTSISPYLTFAGNCEEAFNFYKSVFGGNFPYVGRFKEMPPIPGKEVPEGEGEKIMHISLPISKETVLMGSDSSEAFGHATVMGNNFSISINAESEAKAKQLFNGLSQGGTITMPLDKTFWGALFGMFTDKFGIQWMVNFDYEQKG